MEWSLAIVALTLLGVAAISGRLSGTAVTPAMVFVAVGLLVGPEVLGEIDLESSSATVRALAEATLALVLFCDASRIDLGQLRREVGVPVRLLGIGLPLTIALGAVAAAVIFDQLSDRGGRDPGDRAGADRRRAGAGGRHRAARPGEDPPGAQRRERAQRRDLRAAAVRRRGGGRRANRRSRRAAAPRRSCSRRSATASSAGWSAGSWSRRSSSTPAAET